MEYEPSQKLPFLPTMLGVLHDGKTPSIAGASMNYLRTSVDRCDGNIGTNRKAQISRLGYYDNLIHTAMREGEDYGKKYSIEHIIWREYFSQHMCVFRCNKQTNRMFPDHWEFECLA
jgi:hypothetical protein